MSLLVTSESSMTPFSQALSSSRNAFSLRRTSLRVRRLRALTVSGRICTQRLLLVQDLLFIRTSLLLSEPYYPLGSVVLVLQGVEFHSTVGDNFLFSVVENQGQIDLDLALALIYGPVVRYNETHGPAENLQYNTFVL